ncbi:MAG: HAMP domain-containing protein [Actinobacteria bacterium]|nr:HAMP domain-containing protein [Actinomycetota bacterium]
MPRPWKTMGTGWRSASWDSNAEWWSQRDGTEAWQRFGRRMALRLMVGFLVFFGFLVALGAFIASAVLGSTSESRWVVVVLAPLVVALVVVLIVRYVRRTWLPVRELMAAADSLADGDYTARVDAHGSATVRPVARSFNTMAGRLEQADQQRRQLLADLGHELRTPLTVVRGEVEAMLDGVHDPDQTHLELLLEEVSVMERLIEDLRTLGLAEAGALALHPEPTDVAQLVADVADAHRRAAAAAGVDIDVSLGQDLDDVVLDPIRIREVVANLVVNAVRAMPDGGRLAVKAARHESTLAIEVTDTGVGISPEDLARVFDRFRKGSTSTGSGLGLTISRDLVEAHGGTIAMSSTPGRGTAVIVTLPLVELSA